MSIFAAANAPAGRSSIFEMQAGKATLAGTTVSADPRKGIMALRKSEDGLMHLTWKDRTNQTVEDDLIIFQGDATIRHLPQCKDGYVMLLEFTQTKRKLFFWSQERRKKGLDFSKAEDNAKEKELLDKANRALNGTPEPAPAAATGFGGLTHSELMAMLSGGIAAPAAAAAPDAAAPAPSSAPSPGAAPTAAPAVAPSSTPAAAASTPVAGTPAFSSDAISSILGNLSTPAPSANAPAASAPGAPQQPASAPFSAANLSNILAAVQQQNQPVPLSDVLSAAAERGAVDPSMEGRLSEHLPMPTTGSGESVAGTLNTPQVQQAANAFTEALNNGSAGGLIAEMGLNPTGLGVEPFLRALQEATPAMQAMDTEEPKPSVDESSAPAPDDKMDESP